MINLEKASQVMGKSFLPLHCGPTIGRIPRSRFPFGHPALSSNPSSHFIFYDVQERVSGQMRSTTSSWTRSGVWDETGLPWRPRCPAGLCPKSVVMHKNSSKSWKGGEDSCRLSWRACSRLMMAQPTLPARPSESVVAAAVKVSFVDASDISWMQP